MYYAFDKRWLSSTVTVTLVLINIALYLLSWIWGDALHDAGVLDVSLVVEDGEWRRLATAAFLHADFMHLFSNMVLLFYIGGVVERNIGAVSYLALYLISGITGNLLTVFHELSNNERWTSLGASGAVFGVMGAMLVLLLLVRKQLRGRSSLLYRVGFMIAYSLLTGIRYGGVNNIAHVGGLLTGALICYLVTLGGKPVDVRALI